MDKDKILNLLPFEYQYNLIGDYKYDNEQDFICTLNIKNICTEDEAKNWIAKLGENTLTTWRVQRTYPESGRCNVYKIAMKCQHNVNHKMKSPNERKRSHISKHTGCPSQLILTIRRYIKKSKAKKNRSSNPNLIDWPCFVELKFTHNHPLNTAEVLRFRPLGNEIKGKLINLFKKGHTAASALESIKMELFLENNDKFYELAADRFYIPTISQVQYLFNNAIGSCSKPEIEELISNYNACTNGGHADVGTVGDSKFVTICSPIMTRAHELLPNCSQIAAFESYGNIDKKGYIINFIVTPTPAGSIPLGCFITDTNKKEVMAAALSNLKTCFPAKNSFFGQNFPYIFITDDNLKEQESLRIHFPKSVPLLSQCNILKSAWNWLNCHHNIPKSMREEVYYAFKTLLYCPNENELYNLYEMLLSKYQTTIPKFVSYLNFMWPNRTLWSSAYRINIPIEQNGTFNYVETTFKIMKDCILERIKSFDLTQLVDFILVHFEGYISKRLRDFYEGRVCNNLLYKYIPPTCVINPSMIISSETDSTCFFVPSESDYSIKHMVDIKHCICSCEISKSGRLCKHLCGVINHLETPMEISDTSQKIKDLLYSIATGNEPRIVPDLLDMPSESVVNDEYHEQSNETKIDTTLKSKKEEINSSAPEYTNNQSIIELSKKEKRHLAKFMDTISEGLKNKSDLFVPAVKVMVRRFSKIKSELSFLTAIKMFGKNVKNKHHRDRTNACNSNKKFNRKKCGKHRGTQMHLVNIVPKKRRKSDPTNDPLAI